MKAVMPREVETTVEFQCPTCGSSWYRATDGMGYAYKCSGPGGRGCKFTWSKEDFWKYSVLVVKTSFESHAEYEAARRGATG